MGGDGVVPGRGGSLAAGRSGPAGIVRARCSFSHDAAILVDGDDRLRDCAWSGFFATGWERLAIAGGALSRSVDLQLELARCLGRDKPKMNVRRQDRIEFE